MIKIKIETDCTAIKDAVKKSTKAVKENTKPIGAIILQLIGGGLFLCFGIICLYFGFTEDPGALIMGSVITLSSGCWVIIALRNTANYDEHKKEMGYIPYKKWDNKLKDDFERTKKNNPEWVRDISIIDSSPNVAFCSKDNVFIKNWY